MPNSRCSNRWFGKNSAIVRGGLFAHPYSLAISHGVDGIAVHITDADVT